MNMATNLAFRAAQTYVSVYLKQIIPIFTKVQCQLWVTIRKELKNLNPGEELMKKIKCDVKDDDCFGADTSELGKSVCKIEAPPNNKFAEMNWEKMSEMSKLLLWLEWLDFYKKTNLILSFDPDFNFPDKIGSANDGTEGGGGSEPPTTEDVIKKLKEEYKLLNSARSKSLAKYFLDMNRRIETSWVYQDENGIPKVDIPWEIMFPSPQYYYSMLNVFNLLKLFAGNIQSTFINSIISQAKKAPDSTTGINNELLNAAAEAGSELMNFSTSLFKQIIDYPVPTIVQQYNITEGNFDSELRNFYDKMKENTASSEQTRAAAGGAAAVEMKDLSSSVSCQGVIVIDLNQTKEAFMDSMSKYKGSKSFYPLEMAMAKKDWELSNAKERTSKWKEYVSVYSPLEGKFPPGTSATDKMRDWMEFFKNLFSRFQNQGGALTIFTIEDDIISSIKEAYEKWKIINPPDELKACGTANTGTNDVPVISNEQWRKYLYEYKPCFFSVEVDQDNGGEPTDDWKNNRWSKETNGLQRLWLWNDWVYLYLEAVKMGVDMNLSVPDTLMKQFIRIKLPYWLKMTPKNPTGRIKKWMAFWYNAEMQAMKDAMDKVAKQKAKAGDRINSKIPKIEKERQKGVISVLTKELNQDVKRKQNETVGPSEDRLVDMAKSLYILQQTEQPRNQDKDGDNIRRQKAIGGGKKSRKYVRDQINKTEKRIKKSLQKFTRRKSINKRNKSRRAR